MSAASATLPFIALCLAGAVAQTVPSPASNSSSSGEDFVCRRDGAGVSCRQSAEFRLLEAAGRLGWEDAQRACRLRQMFLVPSPTVLQSLLQSGALRRTLLDSNAIWLGARALRHFPKYYQWLLPEFGELSVAPFQLIPEEEVREPLCLALVAGERAVQRWLPCARRLAVLCVDVAVTRAATGPADHRPVLQVSRIPISTAATPSTTTPGPTAFPFVTSFAQVELAPDEFYAVDLSHLQDPRPGDVSPLTIACSSGDHLVRDGVIIARGTLTRNKAALRVLQRRDLLNSNRNQSLVPVMSDTYWCERYIRNQTEPARSGQLLWVDRRLRVLSAPPQHLLRQFIIVQGLSPKDTFEFAEYDDYGETEGPTGSGPDDDSSNDRTADSIDRFVASLKAGAPTVRRQFDALVGRVQALSDRLRYLAVYDDGSTVAGHERDATVLYAMEAFREPLAKPEAGGSEGAALLCDPLKSGGVVWRQRYTDFSDGLLSYDAVVSRPACYGEEGLHLMRRQCRPALSGGGARWGPPCRADGACGLHGDTQPCLPKSCPAGYSLHAVSNVLSYGAPSTKPAEEGQDRRNGPVCLRRLDDVAFDAQQAGCTAAGGHLWVPRVAQALQLLTLLGQRALWLPARRLWPHGPLWPRSVHDHWQRSEPQLRLDSTLECLSFRATSDGQREIRSEACASRLTALCVSDVEDIGSISGVVPRRPSAPRLVTADGLVFLNLTDVMDVATTNGSLDYGRLECFSSTSANNDRGYRLDVGRNVLRFLDGLSSDRLPGDDSIVLLPVEINVRFSYVVCGVLSEELSPFQRIVTNRLAVSDIHNDTYRYRNIHEYVVGFPSAEPWDSRLCDATFCEGKCPCFTRIINSQYEVDNSTGNLFILSLHPLRAVQWDSEATGGREIYHAEVELNPPARRRRRQTAPQTRSEADAMRLLRQRFGAQLVSMRSARCCLEEETTAPALSWPRTCKASEVMPQQLCADSRGRPAHRRCLRDPVSGARWMDVQFKGSTCAEVSETTRNLHRLAMQPVSIPTVVATAVELETLTAQPMALTAQDVASAAQTLENIEQALRQRPAPPPDQDTVRRSAVATISQLLDVDTIVTRDATAALAAGPRAVRALERTLTVAAGTAATAVLNTTNAVVVSGARYVGLTVGSTFQAIEDSLSPDVNALLGHEAGLLLTDQRLVSGATFLSLRNAQLLQSDGQRVTSRVVSVLLARPSAASLDTSVLFAFQSDTMASSPPLCAFWDFDMGEWSTRGCYLREVRGGSDICVCNHLTNFARIVNFEPDVYVPDRLHRVLDVITYVGCTLSLLGLTLTIATFVLFKKWRGKEVGLRRKQIMVQLSVALVGVYISFLAGLALTHRPHACLAASVLLHYTLLAAFGWMAVEAANMYVVFVLQLRSSLSGFVRIASLCCWGGALLPVVGVLADNPQHYVGQRPQLCWMSLDSALFAFGIPALVVLLFNSVVFGLVVHALTCGRDSKLRTNRTERRQALRQLRISVIICVLLGIPWLFGFFAVREARFAFAVVFSICTSLQGFVIFLLMVVGDTGPSGARHLWSQLISRCCSHTSTAAATSSSNTTGTTGVSGSTGTATGAAGNSNQPSAGNTDADNGAARSRARRAGDHTTAL